MKLTIPKSSLVRLLSRAASVADRKSTMPILGNALLVAEDGALRVSATDLYITVAGSCEAQVDAPGSTALPAHDILERVKAMPEGPVKVTVEGDRATLKASGSARTYKLTGLPAFDFPAVPNPEGAAMTIPAATLASLVARTEFSISNDETRPHLNAALLELRPGIVRMASTDGHRLSRCEVKVDGLDAKATLLIPQKGIGELRKLLADAEKEAAVAISQKGPSAFFQLGDVCFSAKLVDAQFPPYAQVIPENNPRVVKAPRAMLVDALKAVNLVANDKTSGVKIALDAGAIRLAAETPERGSGADEVPAEYEGDKFSIGVNAEYLVAALGAVDGDEVEMRMGETEMDPIVVQAPGGGEFLGVVMPMRI